MNNNKILLEFVNEYYKLKNAYNVKNQNNSRDDKKCIQCNGIGGSIFQVKNTKGQRVLIANCNARKKCSLNIYINTGSILNLKSELHRLTTYKYDTMNDDDKERNTNYLNKEIIIAKNDILFGYTSVNDVKEQLQVLLEDVELQNYAVTTFKTDLLSITDNEEITKKIVNLKKEISDAVSNIKILSSTYHDTRVHHLLEECNDIYKNIILPKTTELRNINYQIQYIEPIGSNNLGVIYEYVHIAHKEDDFEIQMDEELPDIIFVSNEVENITTKQPRKKSERKTKKKTKPEKDNKNEDGDEDGDEDKDEDKGEEENKKEGEEIRIKGKLRVSKKKRKEVNDIKKTPQITRDTIQNIPKLIKGHYTDNILFCIYDNAPNALPGKGKYEKIQETDVDAFKTLETFKDWRSRLSNTNHSVFVLNGHKWYSVYHYYMACQFKLNNPDFYLTFSMDSGNPISRSISKAKEASNMEKETVLRDESIKPDNDYFTSTRHSEELFYGMYANIEQHEDLKRILLNTKTAKLMKFVKKNDVSKFVIDSDLIYIRMLLIEKESKLYETQSSTSDVKVGGNVSFGGNQVKYFESEKTHNNHTTDDGGDDDEDDDDGTTLINIGGETEIDFDIEEI